MNEKLVKGERNVTSKGAIEKKKDKKFEISFSNTISHIVTMTRKLNYYFPFANLLIIAFDAVIALGAM